MTVTPVPFSSSLNASDSESTYAFVAAYAPVIGAGANEPTDPRFTIRPQRRSTMPGRSARVRSVSATTFTDTISLSTRGSASTNGSVLREPGVVHQRVDLDAAIAQIRDQLVARVGGREVLRDDGRGDRVRRLQLFRELLHRSFAACDEHQVEAVPREQLGELDAEPARRPGDQRGPSLAHVASSWKTRSIARRARRVTRR